MEKIGKKGVTGYGFAVQRGHKRTQRGSHVAVISSVIQYFPKNATHFQQM